MTTITQTSKAYFRTLTILHLGLLISLTFFGLVIFVLLSTGTNFGQSDLTMVMAYVAMISAAAGLLASDRVFKIKLNKAKGITDLKEKMTSYRSALIVRYALIEAPAFVAIVSVMLTNDNRFFILALFLTGVLAYHRPTRDKAITDLALDQKEIAIIETDDAIVAEFERSADY